MTRLPWLFGVSAAVLFVGLAGYLASLQPGVVALQLAFTPRAFGEVVHAWSAEGLARYRAHLPLDFALIAAYSAFGYTLARSARAFGRLRPRAATFATWCLPAAGAFDGAENLFHWWLTEAPRFGVPLVYAVSASCALIKWALLVGFGCLAAYACARSGD